MNIAEAFAVFTNTYIREIVASLYSIESEADDAILLLTPNNTVKYIAKVRQMAGNTEVESVEVKEIPNSEVTTFQWYALPPGDIAEISKDNQLFIQSESETISITCSAYDFGKMLNYFEE